MNMRRGRRCPCPTVRGHDASTTMAGRPTAIEAQGWVERLVRRGSASEGGSDTHRPFAHGMDGFRFRSAHPCAARKTSLPSLRRLALPKSASRNRLSCERATARNFTADAKKVPEKPASAHGNYATGNRLIFAPAIVPILSGAIGSGRHLRFSASI